MHAHDLAVVAGVRHHEDHAADATVTTLERDPSLERLDVFESGLRVNPYRNGTREEDVPRAEVALTTDRRLGSPAKRAADETPQSLEQSQMRLIADG